MSGQGRTYVACPDPSNHPRRPLKNPLFQKRVDEHTTTCSHFASNITTGSMSAPWLSFRYLGPDEADWLPAYRGKMPLFTYRSVTQDPT
jgi:hypothetical protein